MVAISLPSGEARGIVIDNPSGSWLLVTPLHDYVPPYTMQWSRDFPMTVASATIRYVDGPASQVSTQQGDPFTAWLDSDPVGASAGAQTPGVPFIEAFTPTLSAELPVQFEITGTLAVTNILPSVTGKRYRIWSGIVRLSAIPATLLAKDVPFTWVIRSNNLVGNYPRLSGYIVPVEHPSDFLAFPSGWDFPSGDGVDVGGRTEWGDGEHTHMQASVTYQLI